MVFAGSKDVEMIGGDGLDWTTGDTYTVCTVSGCNFLFYSFLTVSNGDNVILKSNFYRRLSIIKTSKMSALCGTLTVF